MPIIKSAAKAARQTVKRTAHNQDIKKSIKQALKAFRANPIPENLRKAQSEYDKAVKKNLLSKNTAARRKSALASFAKASSSNSTPIVKTAKTVTKDPTASSTAKTKSSSKTSPKSSQSTPSKAKKSPTTAKPAAKKSSPKAKAQ